MALRAIPSGDERDKDVANAIRFAVDHGARIINMSFGKMISPSRDFVSQAVRYAEEKGVLIVHAAGNNSLDRDDVSNRVFPNRANVNAGADATNWIEVAASTETLGANLAADFSNYGLKSVDLFARGAEILSCIPGNRYMSISGTSMAAPEVTGVAALILSQHPELTPAQIRDLLMVSGRRYPGQQVVTPGTLDILIDFTKLSISGSILDAFAALLMAK